jgi:hypothetical protein
MMPAVSVGTATNTQNLPYTKQSAVFRPNRQRRTRPRSPMSNTPSPALSDVTTTPWRRQKEHPSVRSGQRAWISFGSIDQLNDAAVTPASILRHSRSAGASTTLASHTGRRSMLSYRLRRLTQRRDWLRRRGIRQTNPPGRYQYDSVTAREPQPNRSILAATCATATRKHQSMPRN